MRVIIPFVLERYPLMKLNESDDWNEWKKRILTFFGELGKFYEYQIYLKIDRK